MMDKTRKKKIKQIIAWLSLAALVALLTAMPLLAAQSAEDDGPVATIKSGTVKNGSITRILAGGGTLTEEDGQNITIPSGVKLTEFLVRNGDAVSKGDALAGVDKITVMTAITEVQKTLDYLADQIADADSDEGSSKITAQTAGKVKILYAEAGDNVQDVMLEHGALAVLSLDGRMAVEIERSTSLSAGDSVIVILSDDTEVTGRVESSLGGKLTVSIADNNYTVGEKVVVETEDGDRLGSGELTVHNPWNATAYYGTVSTVHVKENQSVSTGAKLFTLKDVDHSTSLQLLLAQRQEYEEVMQELFTMYQTGVLTAPCDGYVSGVDENSVHLLAAEETGWFAQLLSNTADESGWTWTFLSDDTSEDPSAPTDPSDPSEPEPEEPPLTYTVRVGLVQANQDGSLTLLMTNGTQTVTNLSDVIISTSYMTVPTTENISGADIYELAGGTLLPIDVNSISAGDVLLFTTDSTGACAVVKAGTGSIQAPGAGGQGAMGGMSGIMGGMSGFGSGAQTQTVFVPYDLTESTVLTVTPKETMTLDITIDELDIGKLSNGQAAEITVSALSGETFSGSVTEIGPATNSGGSSKFTVTITMNRAEKMLGGMSATAAMELGRVENVLMIPAAALNDGGSEVFVYTSYDEKNDVLGSPVPVTIGASDGENVEILSGLNAGDVYYYSYYDAPEAQ